MHAPISGSHAPCIAPASKSNRGQPCSDAARVRGRRSCHSQGEGRMAPQPEYRRLCATAPPRPNPNLGGRRAPRLPAAPSPQGRRAACRRSALSGRPAPGPGGQDPSRGVRACGVRRRLVGAAGTHAARRPLAACPRPLMPTTSPTPNPTLRTLHPRKAAVSIGNVGQLAVRAGLGGRARGPGCGATTPRPASPSRPHRHRPTCSFPL